MNTQQQSEPFLIESEMPWERINDHITRQIVGYHDSIMMVKVRFEKGGIGPLHEHYHAQVTYVVNGTFEMTIGEEKRTLQGGDSFFIPPHVMHGCLCTEEGMLIDVFSPLREDFMSSVNP